MKTIPEFPNYKITKDGRVWSDPKIKCRIGKWLKPDILSKGHLRVTLYKSGKPYHKLIHHLVLEVFVSRRPKGMECRHLDGNPSNNKLSNLCWGTRSENMQDAIWHGTHPGFQTKGEKHGNSKLKDSDAKMIVYMQKTKIFNQRDIADIYNISEACVSGIINKERWKHIWLK